MTTMNPFDLLGGDAEDVMQLVAAVVQPLKAEMPAKGVQTQAKVAKLPLKPVPPTQAVREAKSVQGGGRGGGGRGGYGRGRGGAGFNRDPRDNDAAGKENGFSGGYRPSGEGDAVRHSERRGGYGGPRGSFRGGRRGGFNESGEGERPRRMYERRSGTGHGNEFKREGSGRGNWGTPGDEIAPETEEAGVESEKIVAVEKPAGEEDAADVSKDAPAGEPEEKEPEDKEMTLEEYEKLLEEKRKGLQSLKTEGRQVDTKEFESMQQLSNKKSNDEIFIKLGSDKDKRKDAADKEEKAKKSLSINEFLKPAEGENYYPRGVGRGRGRGRGRGGAAGGNDGYYGGHARNVAAPAIQDAAQFPSLGGK